ncbi:MAG: helix-turn-helix transcriptional regulator [Treponema sp.]|nr:helix-turn-helix transcriptional regulator [Treponema sp.]
MSPSFKENLRSELDYQDITIKELSAMTNIPYRSIENYLSARESIPPADYAVQIARALKITVEELVFGKANPQTKKGENDTQKIQRLFSKLAKDDQKFFIRLMEGVLKK